jgi:hypothetical protein
MKKWRDLIRFPAEMDQPAIRLVRVALDESGAITLTGDRKLIADINEEGVTKPGRAHNLFPKDGEEFFLALPNTFRNPMGVQTDAIQEGDSVPSL